MSNGVIHHASSLKKYNEILNEQKTVVVDFYADGCGPCKTLGKVLEKWVKEETYPGVFFMKVDVDDEEEFKELIEEHDISSIPRILIYRGGKLVSDTKGADPTKISKVLDKF